ncbi:MAG: SLC13 family permease [Candidatus Zapsychrus exili]|nr:SLC13 family permease [Candidatus Zapsychrus exili]
MKLKLIFLFCIALCVGFLGFSIGFTPKQALIIGIFSMSITGTLFFWDFRLSFVFIGSGLFFLLGAVDMESFITYASLDVILFLVSMMIIVGMMKEAGFFTWLITLVLRVKNLTGKKMFVIIMVSSALFSGLMDEVTSIIIMTMVILNICDFLEIEPLPFVISSVIATNIGSASTVLGNPVGVLIAARSKLSFEDFITHAFPLSMVVLLVAIFILCFWYRKYISELNEKLKPFQEDKSFLYLISVPPDFRTKISLLIFGGTICLMAAHKRIESLLSLEQNTLLIMIPVISAGIVMLYRHDKARHYIEHEVEWPSLLFFMFLFAQAGVIRASGIADFLAVKLIDVVGTSPKVLPGVVLFSSGFLSSGLDNVVTVASYVPIIQSMTELHINLKPLWWALLFGACYGGNISMIGSTANIVALGLLEKERNIKVTFRYWLKIGATIGIISMVIAYLAILFFPIFH